MKLAVIYSQQKPVSIAKESEKIDILCFFHLRLGPPIWLDREEAGQSFN